MKERITITFGGNSDTWFRRFWPNVGFSPNFFHPALTCRYIDVYRKVSQYRHLDNVSQLRRLEEDVAIATLWPKASLLRWLPPNVSSTTQRLSVAIATFGGSRPSSDIFSTIGITTLICTLHKNTKLICALHKNTKLICALHKNTKLICALHKNDFIVSYPSQ